jgi:Ca2+-binding RTX toxin-like protein
MCQICAQNILAYQSTGAAYASSTEGSQAPQYGGSGANTGGSQGSTSNVNINGVLSGDKWAGSTLTYSFPTLTTQYDVGYGNEITNNFFAVSASIKDAIRYAMGLVSQYSNLVTTEVSPSTQADVRVAGSFEADPTAYAYYPGDWTKAGDIWYGSSYVGLGAISRGQYEIATSIHELGHALGLKHGHETGGPGNTAMQTAFDQMAYSIMTYRSYVNAPLTGYTNEQYGYAQTFMMYDIAALQTMYGANFNTNSGNTTYTWSSTTGEMFINGVGQGAPGSNRIFLTIWDGNGTDTYDFANYTTNMTINLTPGSFSITSATQIANLGSGNTAPGNIFNALQFNSDVRSLIENANGGSGNDTITGNSANNVLHGNNGTDTITGGDGNDTLYGDGGADSLNGGNGNDTLYFDSSDTTVQGGANTDTGIFVGTTSGLRNYDMSGHGLEILQWTTSGNAFTLTLDTGTLARTEVEADSSSTKDYSSRTTVLDSLMRINYTDTTYDTGLRLILDEDYNSSQDWGQRFRWYDTLSRVDYYDTRYDTGVRLITDEDNGSTQSWTQEYRWYDTLGRVDYYDTRYDTGIRLIVDEDNASNQTWTQEFRWYDTLGRVDYYDTRYDTGVRLIVDEDNASNQIWTQEYRWYDTLGRVDYYDTRYDTGTRLIVDDDNGNTQTWNQRQDLYDTLGRLDQRDDRNDNGTRVVTDYDQANAFAWSQHIQTFNNLGVLTSDVYV